MDACPLCQATRGRVVTPWRRPVHVVRCTCCSLLYRTPLELYRAQAYYDRIYRNPTNGMRPESGRQDLFDAFLAAERPARGRRLLDFGCGLGSSLRAAAAHGFDAYGVERSPYAIEAGRSAGLRIASSVDAFSDGFFDVVTLWNVVEFFETPILQLTEIRRVLTPGGLIFIRTPNAVFHWTLWRLGKRLPSRMAPPYAFLFNPLLWNPATLRAALYGSGFSAVAIDNATLSRGDPYGAFPRPEAVVTVGKWALSFVAATLSRTSGRRLLVAPSIEARARAHIRDRRGGPGRDPDGAMVHS